MNKKIRKILSIALAIIMVTVTLTACSDSGNGGGSGNGTDTSAGNGTDGTTGNNTGRGEKVIIYTHDYDSVIPSFQAFLEGEFPEVEFTIVHMPGGNLDAKVMLENRSSEIDIVHGSSSGANNLKAQGFLKAFEPGGEFLPEFADSDNMIAPNGVWCGAFIINTHELERLNLDTPTSFEDLLDPQYKGHIVMANPLSSSTGRFFLLGILNTFGEEEGWQYFEKLNENIFQYTETGSGPGNLVSMGEAAIGLGMDYQGMEMVEKGEPVKVIFPSEGAPFDNDTIVVLDKAEVRPIVLEVAKAMTSPAGNAVFNNYSKSVMVGVEDRGDYGENFKVLDMTGITDVERRAEIEGIWGERIG
jgi:iron(III) transport system substrate-binding protein